MQLAIMQNFFSKAAPVLGIAALGLAAAPAAHAQTTLITSAQTTLITNTLNGAFFQDPAANILSIDQARAYIKDNITTPTGTFTATQEVLTSKAAYAGVDTSTPQSFLGGDGGSYHPTNSSSLTTANLEDGILDITGYVDVTTADSYTFGTVSDDGSALFIDGNAVVSNDGIAPAHFNQNSATLTAGLHPIELVYYNHIFNGGVGGANFAAGFGGLNVTSSNSPLLASPAPEPSAVAIWAFVGLGGAGLFLKARRRRAVPD